MKTMLKRFLPCLLIVLAIFTIVSCGNKDEYKYPSEVPLYEGDGTFVQIGDLKISNKDIYNRLIQSYGVETLEDIIDEALLKDVVLTAEQEAEFKDQIEALKYGTNDVEDLTEEEKAEALKDFEESMLSQGFYTDAAKATDPLYFENYYRLEYKRYVKALEVLKQEIVEQNQKAEEDEEIDPYFTDSDYLSYFTSNYHKTYKLIIVTFDSEKQAKDAMAKADIDLNSLAGAWKSTSTAAEMSNEQIKNAFMNMYESAYGTACEGAKDYTYDDLYKISAATSKDATIVNRAVKLESGEYTHGPLLYSSRWFVIYAEEVGTEYINDEDSTKKFADTDEYIVEKDANNSVTEISDKLKEALYDELVVSSFVSDSTFYNNTISRVMLKLRQDAGLEIFAEGLEVNYKTNYNTVFSSLDITDYDAFKATENTSKTLVAKWNGGEITVSNMFDRLTTKYGPLLTLLFMQQYTVLTSEHNKVVNYTTGQILDQDKYNDYMEEDIDSYKESFEEGNFESYGFPASYGWTNFLRDYIGLTEEAAIIVDFNSTLYKDVLALYTKALYTAEVKDVALVAKADEDGVKTWYLESAKWISAHDTGIKVIDENIKPEISIAWKEADIEGVKVLDKDGKEIKLAKNDYYGHFVLAYKNAEGVQVKDVTPVTVDQAVLEEYDAIYDKSFSATASGLYVYYDADLDGVADEVEEENATLAKELVTEIWDYAKTQDAEKTISENITEIVRQYNIASSSSIWGKYKQASLRVKVISNSTYSNSTAADDAVKELVHKMWNNIVNAEDEFGKNTSIVGQTLDPSYRYVKNSKVFVVNAYDFAIEEAVFADNGFYQLAVVKATNRTSYEYSSASKTQKPSLYYYEQYQLDSKDREVTINCSSQITTYYKPAISNLSSETKVNNLLMKANQELLSKVTFGTNNDQFKATLSALIEAALDDAE